MQYTPITHDRVLQIQNGFNTLYIYWGRTLKKNQSTPTMFGGVSCRYVPIFGSNEVPDPVRALYTPITHDRVLQIQNGFNTLYIYWGRTLKKKKSVNSDYVWRCEL